MSREAQIVNKLTQYVARILTTLTASVNDEPRTESLSSRQGRFPYKDDASTIHARLVLIKDPSIYNRLITMKIISDMVEKYGTDVLEPIKRELEHGDPETQRLLIQAVCGLNSMRFQCLEQKRMLQEYLGESLTELINSPYIRVQRRAIRAVREVEYKPAISTLLALKEDAEWTIKREIKQALETWPKEHL